MKIKTGFGKLSTVSTTLSEKVRGVLKTLTHPGRMQ